MCVYTTNFPFIFFLPLLLILLLHGANSLTDSQALLLFKSQFSDPSNSLSSWNQSTKPCNNWFGITCGSSSSPQNLNRVTSIELTSLNLTGTLSPFLSNLTFLTTLNLSANNFHSNIPPEFGSLANLQVLDLTNNSFTGDIPPSLTHCSKLRQIVLELNHLSGPIPGNFSRCIHLDTIDFYNNQLTGTIPASLGDLPNLKKLNLVRNQLVGGIPPSLGNLTTLSYFALSTNLLEGRIPVELGKLKNLTVFALAFNNLTGEIPLSLFNISSMVTFHTGNNQLSGELPNDMGTTLPNLEGFYVFTNRIGGRIPISLPNASRLQEFVADENMFVGEIPSNLGTLQSLGTFEVGVNQLEASQPGGWNFLDALANCSSLNLLSLPQNKLQGVLPSSVGKLSDQMYWLDMAENNISGIVPSTIGRYSQLSLLDLSLNQFSGTIPESIGMLQNMNELLLFGNRFHGKIPTSIGNLTQISELRLDMNQLEGGIPPSIGNLSHLDNLVLSHNNLNGSISPFMGGSFQLHNPILSYYNLHGTWPGEEALEEEALNQLFSLTRSLNLSHNSFTGPLPIQIGSLINLNVLDLSENRFSGVIPPSLGACQLLNKLFLQGNLLEGVIPSQMSGLKGMQELDLSLNNLSGLIPEFLEGFHLQYLNLSFNNFEGQVPQGGVFGNGTAVSLVGNSRLCGGDSELNLQPCDSTSRSHHSIVQIIIPVVVASLFIILFVVGYYMWRQRSRERESPLMPSLKHQFAQISYGEIYKATNGFSSSNLIGAGSFGWVYKGILDSYPKRVNAIKVLNLGQSGAVKSFLAECESLRVIRHQNLVSVVTVCSTFDQNGNEFKALILDYMPNGSLDEWLHPRVRDETLNTKSLSLVQRLNIVIDVAYALDYLHNQCQTAIIHCDLKPSNVLLDRDMTAHVTDFGLSKFLSRPISPYVDTNSSAGIIGSIGYIAPEYGMGGSATTQGDVYSFGVLLLEIFTGKRPTDETFRNNLNLHKYVDLAYPDRVLDIVDPSILENIGKESKEATNNKKCLHEFMISIYTVGLLCSRESANHRMKMGDVVKELLQLKETLDMWTQIQRDGLDC